MIDGLIVVLYLLGMMGVGFWGYRKAETLDDYLVAGRNIPLWVYGFIAAMVAFGVYSTIKKIRTQAREPEAQPPPAVDG